MMKKLLFLLIPIAIISTCFYSKHTDDIPFDSYKWKNWVEQEHNFNMRKNMINSLKSNHELIGMTKKEIIDLLGNNPSRNERDFHYFIGYGMGINICTMDIIFDKNGFVTEVNFHES